MRNSLLCTFKTPCQIPSRLCWAKTPMGINKRIALTRTARNLFIILLLKVLVVLLDCLPDIAQSICWDYKKDLILHQDFSFQLSYAITRNLSPPIAMRVSQKRTMNEAMIRSSSFTRSATKPAGSPIGGFHPFGEVSPPGPAK